MLAELLPTNGSNTDRIFMLPLLHGYHFLRNWIFAMLALENTVLLTSKNELLKRMIVSYLLFLLPGICIFW